MGGIILWMILGVITGLLSGPIAALSDVSVVMFLVVITMIAIFLFVQPNVEDPGSE